MQGNLETASVVSGTVVLGSLGVVGIVEALVTAMLVMLEELLVSRFISTRGYVHTQTYFSRVQHTQ